MRYHSCNLNLNHCVPQFQIGNYITMVRVLNTVLSVLLLASFALADSQTCGESSYSTFAGELQDGQTIGSNNK